MLIVILFILVLQVLEINVKNEIEITDGLIEFTGEESNYNPFDGQISGFEETQVRIEIV